MEHHGSGKLDLWKLNPFHIAVSKAANCHIWPIQKNPPAIQEMQVRSLGWEDPLEKGMATHSSILAWRIPWTEKPGGSMGFQRVRHNRVTNALICRNSHQGGIWNLGHLIFKKYLLFVLTALGVGFFFFNCGLWGLAPWPGIEPRSPALGAWSLSQWTTREVLGHFLFTLYLLSCFSPKPMTAKPI